jgi:cyclophilin family peptidyl-prolyl cis-trans isomerase
MKSFLLTLLFMGAGASSALFGQTAPNPVVRFQTDLGNIDVVLLRDAAPKTVDNFLGYVDRGDYTNTFIHRAVASFVVQGGGYRFRNNQAELVPAQAPVVNEFKVSNTRGTLAMAKLSGDPNSATNQWFFNEADNSSNLDNQNGGFTVFGRIVDNPGLAVLDAIGALPTYNFGSPFEALPLRNYNGSDNVQDPNFVHLISVTRLPAHAGFFAGEVLLSNATFFLAFPGNGNSFGYYAYLEDPRYIYHFDLGYEYWFDANDGAGGIYFYDFASQSFFYTSPSFGFPYLYDFNLKAVLYYFPDPNNPGRYGSNPRYFFNTATGQVITK